MKTQSAMWMEEGQHPLQAMSNEIIIPSTNSYNRESSKIYNRNILGSFSEDIYRIISSETQCGETEYVSHFHDYLNPWSNPPPYLDLRLLFPLSTFQGSLFSSTGRQVWLSSESPAYKKEILQWAPEFLT